EQFNLIDDDFFAVVMENKKACEKLLQILLQKDDLRVIEVTPQRSIRNIFTRSVILDVLAEDSEHKLYNIEVQTADNDDFPRRMRYNQASIDKNFFPKNKKYKTMTDVYLILISSFDVFRLGKMSYEVVKVIKGTDHIVDDGVHELNSEIQENNSEISDLMQYFINSDSKNNQFGELSEEVNKIKTTPKGVSGMCEIVESMVEELVSKKKKEGKIEIVLNLLNMNTLTHEQIAEATGLTLEEVEALADEMPQ
ncbi:MAG: Rpn family recombination-promoting nuclease/putative transposase, partial [Ruminococcus flavefaciens]|nr:Rpn family recombination-promoting nuclease/putative transposase [Ruminococcus flavefaciens]